MIIKSKNEFKKLLLANGWTQQMLGPQHNYPGDFQCPFDKEIYFELYGTDFYKYIKFKNKPTGIYNQGITSRKAVLARITNYQDFPWDYDANTGIMSNGFCAIRIK